MKDIHAIYSQLKQENSKLKTQLHEVTEELSEVQQRYRGSYENLPVPSIIVNCWGDILECNRLACVFFGKKSKNLCMENLMHFLDVDSRGRMKLFLQMMMEERLRNKIESSDLEIDFFVRGGRYETIVRYHVISQKDEPLLELSILDLSEDKEQRKDSTKEHEWYQVAFQNSKEYVFEYDRDKDILREYGDFGDPSISNNKETIKNNFLQQVIKCQKVPTHSYQLMNEIFLGKKESGELNLAEIDYYNCYGWAYLEIVSRNSILGDPHCIGRLTDITEKKVKELKEKELACKDEMTGFYNSEYGLNLIGKKLESGKLQRIQDHLLLLSMKMTEKMKAIYGETFISGHLYMLGKYLKKIQEEELIVVSRVGDMEFLILIHDKTEKDVIALLNKILQELKQRERGIERYGLIEYQIVLQPTICWENYPDWRLVVQKLYEKGLEAEEELLIIEGMIEDKMCRTNPFVIKEYKGITEITHVKRNTFSIQETQKMEEIYQNFILSLEVLESDLKELKQRLEKSKETSYDALLEQMEDTIGKACKQGEKLGELFHKFL